MAIRKEISENQPKSSTTKKIYVCIASMILRKKLGFNYLYLILRARIFFCSRNQIREFGFQNQKAKILNSGFKFRILTQSVQYVPKTCECFENTNLQTQTQKNVKTESAEAEISKFRHFLRILDEAPSREKYASFRGGVLARTPWFHGRLGSKKVLRRSTRSRNSGAEKQAFLVQNVKN